MSTYDFILDGINFSYSGVSSFETCKQSFKLMYIDAVERTQNFYGAYGNIFHLALEKYFRDELKENELLDYYKENYSDVVTFEVPHYVKDKPFYYQSGLRYFENFKFDKTPYETLVVEGYYKGEYEGFKIVIKPDLVLQEKATGKNILVDFKTANKIDKKKLAGYMKQFYLYSFFLEKFAGIKIDAIWIWFVVNQEEKFIEVNVDDMKASVDWFVSLLKQINDEEEFPANPNKFFCYELCSASQFCQYKPM